MPQGINYNPGLWMVMSILKALLYALWTAVIKIAISQDQGGGASHHPSLLTLTRELDLKIFNQMSIF